MSIPYPRISHIPVEVIANKLVFKLRKCKHKKTYYYVFNRYPGGLESTPYPIISHIKLSNLLNNADLVFFNISIVYWQLARCVSKIKWKWFQVWPAILITLAGSGPALWIAAAVPTLWGPRGPRPPSLSKCIWFTMSIFLKQCEYSQHNLIHIIIILPR